MSNFENPTWRTAAILKIVIAPYLSRESSEYDELIWYADANFDPIGASDSALMLTLCALQMLVLLLLLCEKNSGIPKIKMADGRHIDNHFLAITRLHMVRLRRNLE